MTSRQGLGYVAALLALLLLTLVILGGLPLSLLRDLTWVKSKNFTTGVWGFCPVLSDKVSSPTRFCVSFQRPCVDYAKSDKDRSSDKSSVMTFMALHILAWLFTCIALVQTALRRPIRQPAVYAFIAAICTTISTSLATTFSTCTLDLIRASLHDKTAQLGPARMLSYAAAALLFLAGMLFWFEFKFVKKLHESIVVVGGGKKKDAHGGHGKDAHGHGKDHGHGGGHGKGHGDHHV